MGGLGNEIDAGIGLTVQLSEAHVVIRISGLAILNDYSETCTFFKLRVRYFSDVGAGPICSILRFCVVIIPPVSGRIGSGLRLSGIKVYPAKNVPDIPTLRLAIEIATHIGDVKLLPIGIRERHVRPTASHNYFFFLAIRLASDSWGTSFFSLRRNR
jgi:hypothetical protein